MLPYDLFGDRKRIRLQPGEIERQAALSLETDPEHFMVWLFQPMNDASLYFGIGSALGTIALLILNLKVSQAQSQMRADFITQLGGMTTSLQLEVKNVELSVASLRGDLYQEHSKLYSQVMDKAKSEYMGRELSMQMHRENLDKAASMEKRFDDKFEELNRRIDLLAHK